MKYHTSKKKTLVESYVEIVADINETPAGDASWYNFTPACTVENRQL